ncbi:MAG: hypothetical protein ACI9NY_000962 [Kiritimatiellia bacterium]|jgi:hypothetical protein
MYFWDVLGLLPTNNKREIKKAYAVLLKQHKPEDSAEAYQTLREAYDAAIIYAKNNAIEEAVIATISPPADAVSDIAVELESESEKKLKPRHKTVRKHPQFPDPEQEVDKLLARIKTPNLNTFDIDELFNAEELININSKNIFEEKLFLHLTFCQQEEYSYELAERAEDTFLWMENYKQKSSITYNLERFSSRLDAGRRYLRLQSLTRLNSGPTNTLRKKLGEILTADFNEKKCKKILFYSSHKKQIKNYLDQLTIENPSAFDYEFNTETITWWRDKLSQHNFAIEHLAISIVVGFLPAMFYFQNLTQNINFHLGQFNDLMKMSLSLIAATATGISLAYLLFKIGGEYNKNEKAIKDFIGGKLSFIGRKTNIYTLSTRNHIGIICTAIILYILSKYIPGDTGLAFRLAEMLLLLLFYKTQIFFILIGLGISAIGTIITEVILDHSTQGLPIYAVIALVSHGLIIGCYIKKRGEGLEKIISNGGFVAIYFSLQLIISIAVTVLIIKTGAIQWLS